MDDNGCTVSDVVNLNATGINNVLSLNIRLYPNPASEFMYFDVSQIKNDLEGLEIYDLNGQMQLIVNKNELTTGKIDVRELNQGTYLMIFRLDNQKVVFEKVIIE